MPAGTDACGTHLKQTLYCLLIRMLYWPCRSPRNASNQFDGGERRSFRITAAWSFVSAFAAGTGESLEFLHTFAGQEPLCLSILATDDPHTRLPRRSGIWYLPHTSQRHNDIMVRAEFWHGGGEWKVLPREGGRQRDGQQGKTRATRG